ncbi:MAG: hypothetical protein WKF42_09230 [Solirubrobacteraceae bacterium]
MSRHHPPSATEYRPFAGDGDRERPAELDHALGAQGADPLDEAIPAQQRQGVQQSDAITIDSIGSTEPDRGREVAHRRGQRRDENVVEHASREIAVHDDRRPCLVHLGQPDLSAPG